MIRIHGEAQSRAMRPLWLLEELGLEYEHVKTSFSSGETRAPAFLKLNPNGHVPVLEDGGLVLWESMAINLYLAAKYGAGGLWPASERARALALQWTFWAMTECEAHALTCLLHRAGLPEAQRDADQADAAEQALQGPLGVLDSHLKGREWLVGDGFDIADLNVAAVLSWTRPGRVDLKSFPGAAAWLKRCTGRPGFKAALAR